jgi:hypothetical protein
MAGADHGISRSWASRPGFSFGIQCVRGNARCDQSIQRTRSAISRTRGDPMERGNRGILEQISPRSGTAARNNPDRCWASSIRQTKVRARRTVLQRAHRKRPGNSDRLLSKDSCTARDVEAIERDGVPLNLFGPGTISVQNQRAAVLICYEQLLVWPFVSSAFEHPTVVVTAPMTIGLKVRRYPNSKTPVLRVRPASSARLCSRL